MLLIQFLILSFIAFIIFRTITRFKKGTLTLPWLFFWLLLWFSIGVAVMFPEITAWFAHVVGVGRGVDAVIYLAIIFLYYLIFRIFLRLEKIEHDITLVIREISLNHALGSHQIADLKEKPDDVNVP
jgi:hypothetical protein